MQFGGDNLKPTRYVCLYFVFTHNSIYGNYMHTKLESRFREDLNTYALNTIFYYLISYKIVANYLSTLNTVKKVEKVLHVNESVTLDFTVAICVLISM